MTNETLRLISSLTRASSNPYVEEWKAVGKPVIGYFCHYVPRELILAAGALPLRLRGVGSGDSSLGDTYMSGRVCTYVRHTMTLVLEGAYDFLDGQITSNTCDHVRRAADLFRKKSAVPFHGFLSVPRNPRETLYNYYLDELKKLKSGLEHHFDVTIDGEKLRQAICVMNAHRRRLKKIDQMRLLDRPKLTGAQSLAVHVASQVLPPLVFQGLADQLIAELEETPGLEIPQVRILLVGAELDEPLYVETIESQGALVVADLLCFGARSVLDPIEENAVDPLDAIGRAYFFSSSCARMIGAFPERWEVLTRTVTRTGVDGVIFVRIVFCDPWGAELHNILHRLKAEQTFPLLSLSREYGIVPTGQIKTRVQAFVEKIEIARAQKAASGESQ
jgi:benzoyl-CoA reductase subunit C